MTDLEQRAREAARAEIAPAWSHARVHGGAVLPNSEALTKAFVTFARAEVVRALERAAGRIDVAGQAVSEACDAFS
ncbi:MAG: hypothetical protein VW405_13160, partial [Rhodospirillaceae bacterium]